MPAQTQKLTANLSGHTRYATLNGRRHLVAPITLIVPGVLNGSMGALYYPADEVAKSVSAWNYMPLVVYHPTLNGISVSARSPEVLNKYCVGVLLNSAVNKAGKLKAEGWFDVEATENIDSSIISEMLAGRPIEVSTGLSVDNEKAEEGASFDGIAYEAVARNYRPDHLAILPNDVGACSLADGCGVLANAEDWPKVKEYKKAVVENQPSHNELHQQLRMLIEERYGENAFVEDVFDKQVIFAMGGDLWKVGYKTDLRSDDKVSLLLAAEVKVKRTVKYKVVRNRKDKTMNEKQRASIVEDLVKNDCCYEEEDREVLNGLSDKALEAMQQQSDKREIQEKVINTISKEFTDEVGNKHTLNQKSNSWETIVAKPKEEVVVNAKPQTDKEWLESAPPKIKSAVENAMALEAKEKETLIAQLTANAEDGAKEELMKTLNEESIEKLRSFKALIPEKKVVADYSGSAIPATNRAEFDADDILPDVTLEFSEAKG